MLSARECACLILLVFMDSSKIYVFFTLLGLRLYLDSRGETCSCCVCSTMLSSSSTSYAPAEGGLLLILVDSTSTGECSGFDSDYDDGVANVEVFVLVCALVCALARVLLLLISDDGDGGGGSE